MKTKYRTILLVVMWIVLFAVFIAIMQGILPRIDSFHLGGYAAVLATITSRVLGRAIQQDDEE